MSGGTRLWGGSQGCFLKEGASEPVGRKAWALQQRGVQAGWAWFG